MPDYTYSKPAEITCGFFSFLFSNKPVTFAKFTSVKSAYALLLCSLTFTAFAQRNIDVLHCKYNIGLTDINDSVNGTAEITVKFLDHSNSLNFDLISSNNEGKGMKARMVSGTQVKGFSHSGNKLRVFLLQPFAAGDTITIAVQYSGIPANGLIISKNQFGKRTFFGDNWPNRAHHWLPCVDDPADKASVEFIVTAPAHYQVVANGIQVEETSLPDNKKLTHWKEDVPLPTKVMVIGVADFAVTHAGDVNCIPVSSWVFPENKTEGFYDYATAKDVLAWHIKYIGPYAYKKLANVQSKTMFGGMENAGAIFYHEGSVTGSRLEEELQSHEIVHQWFGNHVTEKSFAHLWLSEGFATYLTHVYMESKYGADSLNKRMKADRETILDFVKTSKRPVVDSSSDYMKLLSPNSYLKGSWVLHMLRRQLGDSVFHKSIRDYYAQYAGKNADTKDLQTVFENNSGKNLDRFFEQWLQRPYNPSLEIEWKYSEKKRSLSITVTQLQQRVFEFPLQVLFAPSAGTSKPQVKTLKVSKLKEAFIIPTGRKSFLLQNGIDPFTSLLCEYYLKEVK